MTAAAEFLLHERDTHLLIEAAVDARPRGAPHTGEPVEPVFRVDGTTHAVTQAPTAAEPVRVSNVHRSPDGRVVTDFAIDWTHGHALTTEYNSGLSVFHDIKDHTLYGLGVTPLTEVQTLVQTHLGRALATGADPDPARWRRPLQRAIHDELFGPRGPRVYDPRTVALLTDHLGEQDPRLRAEAMLHMWAIASRVMAPPLAELYRRLPGACALQRPLTEQADLVRAVVSGLRWTDESQLLLRLRDNIGYRLRVKAQVDTDLARVSAGIHRDIAAYVTRHGLTEQYGAIFDPRDYLLTGQGPTA